MLISHPPYLRLVLRHCTCHLSFKSASPLRILASFHSGLFVKMRLNFASPCSSSPSLPISTLFPGVFFRLLDACFDKHTANTLYDSAPFPLLSNLPLLFPLSLLPGFSELYLLARLFADSSPPSSRLVSVCYRPLHLAKRWREHSVSQHFCRLQTAT